MEKLPLHNRFEKWDGKQPLKDYLFKMMVWLEDMYADIARFSNRNIISLQPSIVTEYIDLPLDAMFGEGPLVRLPITTTGAALGLFCLTGASLSWRTLSWIAGGASSGAAYPATWHCNFRLPGDYVPGTDLTVHLSSQYNPNAAVIKATIACEARRNIPGTGKQGFGTRSDPANDATWTDSTLNLITSASPLNVLGHDSGAGQFDNNTFTVDGDNASFPLSAGNLIQLVFDSVIDKDLTNVSIWFADFYVTYNAYRVMPTE